MKIRSLSAYTIFDSRGNPTLETELILDDGTTCHGLVPSGASTGQFEALELRDGDPHRFCGQSVHKAIHNVENILAPAIIGQQVGDLSDLRRIDDILLELDGTDDKSKLGANAILGVSLACARAGAATCGLPLFRFLGQHSLLPLPEIQIFGGGAHAHWRTDVQDYLVMAVGARSYAETLEMTFHVYRAAGELMRESGRAHGVADEGGHWPEFSSNEEALQVLVEAITRAGYEPGRDLAISLDIASSDLFDPDTGLYSFKLDGERLDSAGMVAKMRDWCDRYPIVSLEDPLADVDPEGWASLCAAIGSRVQMIGDDLFTTNLRRIRAGVADKLANAVLIKFNQIGTVSETLEAIHFTQEAGWNPVVSARSGETCDSFITHLAVGTGAGQLKVGSFTRSERMAKWNEGLRIARMLGEGAEFQGGSVLPGRRGARRD